MRLITTWGAAPAFNMGLDEALLLDQEAPPTLRLYSWSPDTLSLGYFQRFAAVPGARNAGALVRRITGGGAIHHVNELTFSLTMPLSHPLYRGPIASSYGRVHASIANALAHFGIAAAPAAGRSLASDRSDTGMCFHHSTPADLVWGGRKGVGSAQRRKHGRVLHHGSIKLGSSELEGDIAEVSAAADEKALAQVLLECLARDWNEEFNAAAPTEEECANADLLGPRYTSAEFLQRR